MNILIVTPAPPRSRAGNRMTALRWARFLRNLGHRVVVKQNFDGKRYDLLVALHARKSFPALAAFRRACPGKPIVLALTGTDLYKDIRTNRRAKQSLEWADRIVVLQPKALDELSPRLRTKTRVIHQSVVRTRSQARPSKRSFDVCVLGHLRPVKDPFRAAKAARMLPHDSRVRILHLGAALSKSTRRIALAEAVSNPRYTWLGDVPHGKAMRMLARSRLMVLSSKMEGGANAVGEAIVHSIPVICSRISGSIGLLGNDHPGYFPVVDTATLARLLHRAETDFSFYHALKKSGARCVSVLNPKRELRGWRELLAELPR